MLLDRQNFRELVTRMIPLVSAKKTLVSNPLSTNYHKARRVEMPSAPLPFPTSFIMFFGSFFLMLKVPLKGYLIS